MAFDIIVYAVAPFDLAPGAAITLAYPAGRTFKNYKLAGAHYALGPNNAFVTAPGAFSAVFNAPSIAITWNGPRVPAGETVAFQFERNAGPSVEGKEVALADMSNVDMTATGFQPSTSPAFTGNPTAPTPPPGDNDTTIATTAFVQAAIALLVNSSPAALDTLNELAAALGNDANFATTVTNALALKAPLASPALSGTVDVQGGFRLSGDVTPAQITANQNDYTPAGTSAAAVLRLSSDAPRTITGLGNVADGRMLVIENAGAFDLTLDGASVASTAANRFAFGGPNSRVLLPGHVIVLLYDATAQRWRDIAAPVDLSAYATKAEAAAFAVALG